jgi:hypothetical protein
VSGVRERLWGVLRGVGVLAGFLAMMAALWLFAVLLMSPFVQGLLMLVWLVALLVVGVVPLWRRIRRRGA